MLIETRTTACDHRAPSSQTMTWQIFRAQDLQEAMGLWRQLENMVPQVSVACSAVWTESWLQAYGDLLPWEIVVARTGNTVRGICLITSGLGQKVGPFPVRTRHLGTAGEPTIGSVCVEYNRLLVDSDFRNEFLVGITERLKADPHWEQLRFDGFAQEELELLLRHFPDAQIRCRDCKYFDFADAKRADGDVLSQLGRSTRSNLKRRLKQYGELTCEWAESADQAVDILDELIELHQARWESIGEPGAFAHERFRRFQTDAALKLFLEGKAVLFRVRQQEETIGCLLLLNDRNRLLDYLSGFASFEHKPSPGLISHYLCMVEASRRGFDAYDFLVGAKRHKDNLSNQSTQLHWATISRASWKQTAVQLLRACKQKLRHLRGLPPRAPISE